MIEYAGLGRFNDNVDPELRHKADVIVASNNDHGVAEVRRFYSELIFFLLLKLNKFKGFIPSLRSMFFF
jgi:hypothetical protein